MSEGGTVYLNGSFMSAARARVSAFDRGFTLGDGAFETMLAANGRPCRVGDHLDRLAGSAGLIELPLPPRGEMEEALREMLRRNGLKDGVLRLAVSRGKDTGRGIALPAHPRPTVFIRATPLAAPLGSIAAPVHVPCVTLPQERGVSADAGQVLHLRGQHCRAQRRQASRRG